MYMADNAFGRPDPRAESASAPAARDCWDVLAGKFRAGKVSLPQPWEDIFGPLRTGAVDDMVVVAQSGQSIDARIATPGGDSHYVNGEAGLDHLHRLRALVDAVVVGVGTAIADDPRLTVRRVSGENPARVVIDPNARLPLNARLLHPDGARTLIVTAGSRPAHAAGSEIIALQASAGGLDPGAVLLALGERGFRRILIEGGAETISRFLAARCLDRLHILVAPIILGAGRASLTLPPVLRIEDAMRVPMRAHVLTANAAAAPVCHNKSGQAVRSGADLLLDCDLSAHRVPIGRAKIST
jgi:riboflavin-specific deaminase-like protein